ncbi:auxin-responsive protein SAUR27-like [Diospyros lotus]|uniref:auxin-responsive protein SAUR27-like n=1 Tax=Diospyros lotus TaxID=55363 RepID=UPI00224E5B85|nr:auxin-responsive protein SAUR27-like [Diospyros lotus]
MKKIRGFKLKSRVTKLFRYVLRRASGYGRLDPPVREERSISRLLSCLKTKAKSLCSANPGRGYTRLGKEKPVAVPKGHMAVYVAEKGGGGGGGGGGRGFHRFLVPVIYFNHPLFAELLREAEEEFGYNHPGGITIPCRVAEFEQVQTRIAAVGRRRKLLTWTKG